MFRGTFSGTRTLNTSPKNAEATSHPPMNAFRQRPVRDREAPSLQQDTGLYHRQAALADPYLDLGQAGLQGLLRLPVVARPHRAGCLSDLADQLIGRRATWPEECYEMVSIS